jgi:hypothetical protein
MMSGLRKPSLTATPKMLPANCWQTSSGHSVPTRRDIAPQTELLEAALSHIEAYRDTEEVDSLASADDCIADAIEALSIKHLAEAKSTGEAATVSADVARTESPILLKE